MGSVFCTRSDTEVVLAFLRDAGEPDASTGSTGCSPSPSGTRPSGRSSRPGDRIGEKPLYYFADPRRLVFASEIKAILTGPDGPAGGRPRGSFELPRLRTRSGSDHHVPKGSASSYPGTIWRSRDGASRPVSTGTSDPGAGASVDPGTGEDEFAEQVHALLDDSVRSADDRRRARGGVPERRGRFERDRGACDPARDRTGEDVLARIHARRRPTTSGPTPVSSREPWAPTTTSCTSIT